VVTFRNSKFVGRNSKKKEAVLPHIKFYFYAGQAKPEPPLGPVIAMFQLNMVQVCKDLNDASADYELGVQVGVKVYKKAARVHTIKLGIPTFKFLLETALLSLIPMEEIEAFNQVSSGDDVPSFDFPSNLPVSMFYDVVRVHAFFNSISIPSATKTIFATLYSMNTPILRSIVL
jgi:ribosomal protein L11